MIGAILFHGGFLVGVLVVMEIFVCLVHRHVMHGFGWTWHKSHHAGGQGGLELNDAYALVFAALTMVVFLVAPNRASWIYWLAIGVSLYGVLYAFVHEILVHRRLAVPIGLRNRYLARLVAAHHLHHAVHDRDGAVSFGFLYAPPLAVLRARLRTARQTAP